MYARKFEESNKVSMKTSSEDKRKRKNIENNVSQLGCGDRPPCPPCSSMFCHKAKYEVAKQRLKNKKQMQKEHEEKRKLVTCL